MTKLMIYPILFYITKPIQCVAYSSQILRNILITKVFFEYKYVLIQILNQAK